MKWYGYGILRPALDRMLERITTIDKLFVLGVALIFVAHLLPLGMPYPTIPTIGGFGEYQIPDEVSQDALLNKTDSLKALLFISICYVIAKVGELTNKKKDRVQHHENYD